MVETELLGMTNSASKQSVYDCIRLGLNSSDCRVVRAFAFGAVDFGLIPSLVKPMTSKLVFTASLLDTQH